MADDILKNIPLPANLPENWTAGQIIAPTGAEAGLDDQHGYNYLMRQVNNAQRALKALAAQREEDLARIKFWVSNDPTSPASFIGGTWERVENCTIWGASDTHPAGTTVEAGLPNITGEYTKRKVINSANEVYNDTQGPQKAFGVTTSDVKLNSIQLVVGSASIVGGELVTFNASLSNPIYGSSTTVQPPAYCMYIWRRVA